MKCPKCGRLTEKEICDCSYNVKKYYQTQKKIAETKEKNNLSNPNKIKHFGIWFDKNPKMKINRDYYALIDKKVHIPMSNSTIRYYQEHPNERERIFEDENCTIYSDEYCKRHRNKCLKNFDLNMKFFSEIDVTVFKSSIDNVFTKVKSIIQVTDLNACNFMQGVNVNIKMLKKWNIKMYSFSTVHSSC